MSCGIALSVLIMQSPTVLAADGELRDNLSNSLFSGADQLDASFNSKSIRPSIDGLSSHGSIQSSVYTSLEPQKTLAITAEIPQLFSGNVLVYGGLNLALKVGLIGLALKLRTLGAK
ncbi:MAG: hypothetical protein HC825_05090 [Oscillatoriales cyanobacterium RM1_1_9]|nr:hypothetical protein [Oscillatoriales cyanobacterium RM1_1_9]